MPWLTKYWLMLYILGCSGQLLDINKRKAFESGIKTECEGQNKKYGFLMRDCLQHADLPTKKVNMTEKCGHIIATQNPYEFAYFLCNTQDSVLRNSIVQCMYDAFKNSSYALLKWYMFDDKVKKCYRDQYGKAPFR